MDLKLEQKNVMMEILLMVMDEAAAARHAAHRKVSSIISNYILCSYSYLYMFTIYKLEYNSKTIESSNIIKLKLIANVALNHTSTTNES